MKFFVLLFVGVLVAVAEAESSDPKPSPTPGPISGEMEEPVLPTPDATPGDADATLLPESDELPAKAAAEQPTRASTNRLSLKSSAGEKGRFAKVQSMAMSSPRAAYLLKRARKSSSVAARRTYLRAYYSTVAARMRAHHRPRKVAARHRYERMMIIYYPYGPGLPPYGPPMVFDPW